MHSITDVKKKKKRERVSGEEEKKRGWVGGAVGVMENKKVRRKM